MLNLASHLHRIHEGALDFVEYDYAEGECGDERNKYGREQQVNVRVHWGVSENQVIRKHYQEQPHLDAKSHEVAGNGCGSPSVLILAMPPNTTMNMMVVMMGWIKNHSGPRMVCLYQVTISRFTNMRYKSRYCQSSPKSTSSKLDLGLMTVVH